MGKATNSPPAIVPASSITHAYPLIPDSSPKCFSITSFYTHTSNRPINMKAQGNILSIYIKKEIKLKAISFPGLYPSIKDTTKKRT